MLRMIYSNDKTNRIAYLVYCYYCYIWLLIMIFLWLMALCQVGLIRNTRRIMPCSLKPQLHVTVAEGEIVILPCSCQIWFPRDNFWRLDNVSKLNLNLNDNVILIIVNKTQKNITTVLSINFYFVSSKVITSLGIYYVYWFFFLNLTTGYQKYIIKKSNGLNIYFQYLIKN